MSEAAETFLIGGVGLGKSFSLGCRLAIALQTRGVVCGLFAPTSRVVQKATWRQVRDAWKDLDFLENRDFIINKQPPANWGVEPFANHSHGIITTRFGSYCILDGLLDPRGQVGTELDEIFVDEYRDVTDEARDILLGRLRGKIYTKMGKKPRIWYATTPPENVAVLRKLYEKQDPEIKFVFGASHENPKIKEYLKRLEATYDDITYRREVLGELIAYSSLLYFCGFVKEKTVKPVAPDFRKALYLSFDFNIDPMTCLAAQHSGGEINILKEWFIKDSQIPKGKEPIAYIAELANQYASQFPAVYVTGDSSGSNRNTMARKGETNYTIIKEKIKGCIIQKLSQNPELGNSRAFCNSLLEKHKALSISPYCVKLIEDLENVKVKQNNDKVSIDKTNPDLTHISDCFRYYLHTYHRSFMEIKRTIDLGKLDI